MKLALFGYFLPLNQSWKKIIIKGVWMRLHIRLWKFLYYRNRVAWMLKSVPREHVTLTVWNKLLFSSQYISEAHTSHCQQPYSPSSSIWLPLKTLESYSLSQFPLQQGSAQWDLSRSLQSPFEKALVILVKDMQTFLYSLFFLHWLSRPSVTMRQKANVSVKVEWRWGDLGSFRISLNYTLFLVCLVSRLLWL